MPEAELTAPVPEETPTTAGGVSVTGKVSILEMIVSTETEAERLETWVRLTITPEAKIWLARRAHIARMTVRTLDLLRENEKEFVEIIRNKNEVANRKKRQ